MPILPPIHPESASHVDLVVRGKRVITQGGERSAAIHISGGVIVGISAFDDMPEGCEIYEAGNLAVMPGLVDTHVHINEPGRTEWEGFSTATMAAAAGGITTLIEMPLNSIPATTTAAGFQDKIAATSGKLWVDTGFWGGLVAGNADELGALWHAGCFGFKCFLIDSGVPEFAHVTEADLRDGLTELAKINGPLLAHAELPGPIDDAAKRLPANAPRQVYKTWLDSHPSAAEDEAIALLLRLGREYDTHIHIVHLASASALPQIQCAKSSGARLTIETCPHYLTFSAEDISDGATQFKCAPPIRDAVNREELWSALRNGTVDMIATDHSPCPPQMKQLESGDFLAAWGGIASLQLSLPAVWTEARSRGYSLTHLAKWLCECPAQLAGLAAKKGAIAIGRDADLVIWNPDATFHVDPASLYHRYKLTPYAGRELFGTVESTFLRGTNIYDHGTFRTMHTGQVLLRGKL